MPKAEFGTPKDIAKRMKAKGLQKLRWYCQVCEKQCRDENGFKCHITSESHQRQMKLVSSNADKHIKSFTRQFLNDFINILSRRFGTRRVLANAVYQEYIHDRNHLHMNATVWHSLTEFVQFLAKEGICKVDETERGWYIAWIDNSPEAMAKRELAAKKIKMDNDSEKFQQALIEKQIERAYSQMKEIDPEREEEAMKNYILAQRDADEKIVLDIKLGSSAAATSGNIGSNHKGSSAFDDDEDEEDEMQKLKKEIEESSKRKKSNLEEILQEERAKKRPTIPVVIQKNPPPSAPVVAEKVEEPDYWLFPGIIVRIINKELANGKFYKQKGRVLKVIDDYGGQVCLLSDETVLQLDQDDLETVIPQVGSQVIVLKGAYRGHTGVVISLNSEAYQGQIRLSKLDETVLLDYEDFSKASD